LHFSNELWTKQNHYDCMALSLEYDACPHFFLRYKNFIKNQVISLHTRDKTNSGKEAKKTSLRPDLIAKRASSVLISNLRTFPIYS